MNLLSHAPVPKTGAIRIFIVDDHPLFRQGLKRLLESEEDLVVIGEASDGNEAVQCVRSSRPDVVLMDISMPNLNGLEACRKIKQIAPKTAIIFLTMHEDPFIKEEGTRIGASGLLFKKSVDVEVYKAIRKVHAGETYFSVSSQENQVDLSKAASFDTLSRREKEILRLLANGVANSEISLSLGISVNTVETHRKNLMKKLRIRNLSGIIRYALLHGLISP